MPELFARLEPPVGGRERLQHGLQRRARRRRRTRSLVGATVTAGVVLTAWLSRPSPSDPVVTIPAAALDPSAHPAIAVLGGAPPVGAELRGGLGSLRPVATQADDVVLYLHDPDR